jgi:hypothetical protein
MWREPCLDEEHEEMYEFVSRPRGQETDFERLLELICTDETLTLEGLRELAISLADHLGLIEETAKVN